MRSRSRSGGRRAPPFAGAGGDDSLVHFERDPAIEAIVGSWPKRFETPRALAMGFEPAEDMDAAIQSHLREAER